MPELPEVQTIVNHLSSVLKNKKIKNINILRDKNILTSPSSLLSLKGESFLYVSRRAKYLIFHLTNSNVIVSHLRMEGKYFLEDTNEVKKHDLIIYEFEDGTSLHYNDVRKFGTIEVYKENNYLECKSLASLGDEPFEMKDEAFFEGLQKRKKTPIKEALLDQTLIVGVGNIYDSEILYKTNINPKTLCKDISFDSAKRILEETRIILEKAIKEGGSTIRSYHPEAGKSGHMQESLQVYGKTNEPCPRCGFPIRRIFQGGRSTFYCPHCQKEENKPFIIGVCGPIAAGKSTVSKYLKDKGYIILDADYFAHESYEDRDVKKKLEKEFTSSFKKGKLDRKILLAVVLENKEKMAILNSIIHPYVFKKTREGIANNPNGKIVIDMPLLLDTPFINECDVLIGVIAPKEERMKRLLERGVDVKKAMELNSSFPIARLKKEATLLIETVGTLEELKEKLDSYDYL